MSLTTESLTNPTILPWLPELPEEPAAQVFDMLEYLERKYVAPNHLMADYAIGTALKPDDIVVLEPQNTGPLITADHATDPVRKATGQREHADHGTAALAAIHAIENSSTAIIPTGDQTSNANVDPAHPLKEFIKTRIVDRPGYLSLHGMRPGKISSLSDTSEMHAIIGLGSQWTHSSLAVAELVKRQIKDELGLRVAIGNQEYYLDLDESGQPKINENDGTLATKRLAAMGGGSNTNYVQRHNLLAGADVPAMQLEVTRGLRLLPNDFEWHPDKKARIMSVYMGYLLTKKVVKLLQ